MLIPKITAIAAIVIIIANVNYEKSYISWINMLIIVFHKRLSINNYNIILE